MSKLPRPYGQGIKKYLLLLVTLNQVLNQVLSELVSGSGSNDFRV